MKYNFYNADGANCAPITNEYKGINNPRDLYDALSNIWCEYSCAPSLRNVWSEDNKTAGQCSITAFLVQDIFGGEVYGIALEDGARHCFNKVGDCIFDLTSEQFGGKELDYSKCELQSREEHFARQEKYERYLYLKEKLKNR